MKSNTVIELIIFCVGVISAVVFYTISNSEYSLNGKIADCATKGGTYYFNVDGTKGECVKVEYIIEVLNEQ